MQRDTMLIVEFTTAGGVVEGMDRAADISIEGLAMVKALVDDAIAGGFDVHVLLHESIDPVNVFGGSGITVHVITAEDMLPAKLGEIAPMMDLCFLVAPEFGNILYDLTTLLETIGCHVLSQPSSAILDASDKKTSLDRLATAGIHIPRSQGLSAFLQHSTLSFPIVVKPVHGAGCIGVYKAGNDSDVVDALAVEESLQFPFDELLAQEFIKGEQLSASAIATKASCYLLGINEQDVTLQPPKNMPSKYTGGIVGPIHSELWETCTGIARVMANIFFLEGYFGFDFILDEQGDVVVVEINPRLTTSFVGLKQLHDMSFLRFIAEKRENGEGNALELNDTRFACYEIVELDHVRSYNAQPGSMTQPARNLDILMMNKDEQRVMLFLSATGTTRQGTLDALKSMVKSITS